ncbi:hypothetical protein [Ruegeria lacuscaerulensis]|uniref:hypothetical protein n=1 Tax=Ruegeria lacuscaerulensis TaxID=55218 RepID=UPI00147FCAE1|nr:hypothetical protein [Ruegeria lacuscaerulensis]
MLGWKIFVHSVRMVFGNFKQALQITLGPSLIATALTIALFFLIDIPWDQLDASTGAFPSTAANGSFAILVVCVAIFFVLTMFWIAVSWHRFILLTEYPSGIFPAFRFDRILAYLGRILLLGLLMGVAFLPMSVLLLATGGGAFSAAVMVVYAIFLIVAFYRLSVILPAAALGEPLSLSNAWGSTSSAGGAIIVLLVVNALFQFLVQMVFSLLAIIPILGILLTLLFSMLVLPLINVSILTTMYGVFIEKRELD